MIALRFLKQFQPVTHTDEDNFELSRFGKTDCRKNQVVKQKLQKKGFRETVNATLTTATVFVQLLVLAF